MFYFLHASLQCSVCVLSQVVRSYASPRCIKKASIIIVREIQRAFRAYIFLKNSKIEVFQKLVCFLEFNTLFQLSVGYVFICLKPVVVFSVKDYNTTLIKLAEHAFLSNLAEIRQNDENQS